MSKYYWQRGDSSVAFIYTARQLSSRIKTSCANANHKKYTFYGLQDISRFSSWLTLVSHVINSIYPSTKIKATVRELLIEVARGIFRAIVSLWGECDDIIGFSSGVNEEVSDLMDKEDRLLNGLLKSAREQKKKL